MLVGRVFLSRGSLSLPRGRFSDKLREPVVDTPPLASLFHDSLYRERVEHYYSLGLAIKTA